MTENNIPEVLKAVHTFLTSAVAEYHDTPEDGAERSEFDRGYIECAKATLSLINVLSTVGDFKITDEEGTPLN